ncbi:MAG: hypothetical protein NTV06_01280 [candidate division Zixibacteria bacterium]|nr:hypothetical protein [candidate division Zixibacteria bacterium]
MAMLFNTGYSTPLSFIVVAGSAADEGYADLIAENMKVKAGLPIFRPDCFRPNIISLAAKYFVSLGLTVDI